MKKKILIGLLVAIVLLAGLIGYSVVSSNSEPTMILPTPNQTAPAQPAPTPSPPPTQTPTPTPPRGVISTQEFILNALAGKYQPGEIVEISAIYEEMMDLVKVIGGYAFFFGPKTSEYYVVVATPVVNGDLALMQKINTLSKGDIVVIKGEFGGTGETETKKKVVILKHSKINKK